MYLYYFSVCHDRFYFYTDGTHCPMALFWPTGSSDGKESPGNLVSVSKLSEFSGELKLHPNTLFANATVCPQDFYWKGELGLSVG